MPKSKLTTKRHAIDFTEKQFSKLIEKKDGRWNFTFKPLETDERFVSENKPFHQAVAERQQAMTTMARSLLGRPKINIEGLVGKGVQWITLV